MSVTLNGLSNLAVAPMSNATRGGATDEGGSASWFAAVAQAWGRTLDNQAQRITEMSSEVAGGLDQPSQVAELTAESLRFSFLANAESTSVDSIGHALETMARKQ